MKTFDETRRPICGAPDMPTVFMRHSKIGIHPDVDFCPSVYRFEPVGSRSAALSFLSPNGDPGRTWVGIVPHDAEMNEWLSDGAQHAFQPVFECTGNGVRDWKRARDLKATVAFP